MVRQKLTLAEGWQAVDMSHIGFNYRRVAGQMRAHHSEIDYLMQRLKMVDEWPWSGKSCKTTPRKDRLIARCASRNHFATSKWIELWVSCICNDCTLTDGSMTHKTVFGGSGVTVWFFSSFNCKLNLHVIQANLNGVAYYDNVLKAHIVPYFDNHPLADRPIFMDDNARPHRARDHAVGRQCRNLRFFFLTGNWNRLLAIFLAPRFPCVNI